MDIKHLFAQNPLCPAYQCCRRPASSPPPQLRPDRSDPIRAASWTSAPRRIRIRVRQRGPAAPGMAGAVRDGRPAGHRRRVAGVHRRRRLLPPRALAQRRVGHGAGRGLARAVVLGAARRQLARVHAHRAAAAGPRRSRRARQLLRGRRVRPLGRRTGCPRGGVGGWCADADPTGSQRSIRRPATAARAGGRCSATVWQWTASAYSAVPGLQAGAGRRRRVQRQVHGRPAGAAGQRAASRPQGHTRATYRNFFPARARWAFSGLRLASDA